MKKRQVIETSNKELIPYKRYGEKTNDLSWWPISKDDDSKYEVYLIKFDPGSSSNFHRHNGNEEFYVIYGKLIDNDGNGFTEINLLTSTSNENFIIPLPTVNTSNV